MRAQRSKKKPSNTIFIRDFEVGRSYLYLYEDKDENKYNFFKKFIEFSLNNNLFCIYLYPKDREKMEFREFYGNDNFMEKKIIQGKIIMLKNEDLDAVMTEISNIMKKVEENGLKGLAVIIDFGKIRKDISGKLLEVENFLHSLEITSICSYQIHSLSEEFAEKIMDLHQRIIVSHNGKYSIIFSNLTSSRVIMEPISQRALEMAVKKSLHIIILALLRKQPMCGFDIIKTLVREFNVLLSQGTVYPILYKLEQKGYLKTVVKQDNKTKLYVPTPEGLNYMDSEIREYLKAQSRILALMESALSPPQPEEIDLS